ncbi:MAG: hypothetical protein MUD00_00100 [Candidatus Pacebacteria bacterium]|jgi:hypothetical protein|nr:hypothetical protein [Candidatus Paceibacterota bacterium]
MEPTFYPTEETLTAGERKVLEYVERIENGEDQNLLFKHLGISFKEGIEKLLAERTKEKTKKAEEKKVEEIREKLSASKQEKSIDLSGMPILPSKWSFLITEPELLEEMWTFAIPVDEEEHEKLKAWKARGIAYAKEYAKNNNVLTLEATEGTSEEMGDTEALLSPERIVEKEIILPDIERLQKSTAIGDLNGSYKSFIDHLTYKNLIATDQNGNSVWTGGNERVVFIGDILGDRSPEGMSIYEKVQELQNQAKMQGGDIEWISGNHENMFNAVLCGFSTEQGKPVAEDMTYRLSGYAGNLELFQLLPFENKKELYADITNNREQVFGLEFQKDIQKKKRILDTIRNNPEYLPSVVEAYERAYEDMLDKQSSLDTFCRLVENNNYEEAKKILFTFIDTLSKKYQDQIGNTIIANRSGIKEHINNDQKHALFKEAFLNQKLLTLHDDSLYTHTSLTPRMVGIIKEFSKDTSLKEGVEKINTFYQKVLRMYLENDNPESLLTKQEIQYFNLLRDEFISTSSYSRVNFSESNSISDEEKESLKTFLKDSGINIVLHGHTDENGELKGFADLPIVSIDRSVYKNEGANIEKTVAYASISTDGIVALPK